jgi:hypothetical protein
MPWEGCSVMEERLRFVTSLLDGSGGTTTIIITLP